MVTSVSRSSVSWLVSEELGKMDEAGSSVHRRQEERRRGVEDDDTDTPLRPSLRPCIRTRHT